MRRSENCLQGFTCDVEMTVLYLLLFLLVRPAVVTVWTWRYFISAGIQMFQMRLETRQRCSFLIQEHQRQNGVDQTWHWPWVHFKPGLQLAGFRCLDSSQDLPTVHVDDLHRQVAHLTGLIQRLREETMLVLCDYHWWHLIREDAMIF